jgi:O-acetyl-ADP-ribose deacetylase (regulator of RNase III)
LARPNGVKAIAFPAISCGVYGYPVPQAVRIAMHETRTAVSLSDTLEQVVFACFTDEVFEEYKLALKSSSL